MQIIYLGWTGAAQVRRQPMMRPVREVEIDRSLLLLAMLVEGTGIGSIFLVAAVDTDANEDDGREPPIENHSRQRDEGHRCLDIIPCLKPNGDLCDWKEKISVRFR